MKKKINVEENYKKLMEDFYDKVIHIIPQSKKEWFEIPDNEQHLVKFKYKKERKEAIEYLLKRQKQCGYYPCKI